MSCKPFARTFTTRREIPRNPQEAAHLAEQSCAVWNQHYPPGTRVKVYRLLGDEKTAVDTLTESQAWVMGGHSAMVMVKGLSGGHALTHVKPHAGSAANRSGKRAGALPLTHDTAAAIATELESGVAA